MLVQEYYFIQAVHVVIITITIMHHTTIILQIAHAKAPTITITKTENYPLQQCHPTTQNLSAKPLTLHHQQLNYSYY